MSNNQVKQQLLKQFKDAYEQVMQYLDEKFLIRMQQEQDSETMEKLKRNYKEIGEKITKDYCNKINEIISLTK